MPTRSHSLLDLLRHTRDDARRLEPPIGALLVLTLVLYGCLCIYGMTQL